MGTTCFNTDNKPVRHLVPSHKDWHINILLEQHRQKKGSASKLLQEILRMSGCDSRLQLCNFQFLLCMRKVMAVSVGVIFELPSGSFPPFQQNEGQL